MGTEPSPLNAERLAADIFRARAEEAGIHVGIVETSAAKEDGSVFLTAQVRVEAADIAALAEAERIADIGDTTAPYEIETRVVDDPDAGGAS